MNPRLQELIDRVNADSSEVNRERKRRHRERQRAKRAVRQKLPTPPVRRRLGTVRARTGATRGRQLAYAEPLAVGV
jgi:hypothetical protein